MKHEEKESMKKMPAYNKTSRKRRYKSARTFVKSPVQSRHHVVCNPPTVKIVEFLS